MAPTDLDRAVRAELVVDVAATTDFVLSLAVASTHAGVHESLRVSLDGEPVAARELDGGHGTRLQLLTTGAGELRVEYEATVSRGVPLPLDELDAIAFLRPSRYVEADTLTPLARGEFAGLAGIPLLQAVESWVHDRLSYAPGAGGWRGGARSTLEAGNGVCRDFAHVTLALLRAMDVPARMVSVYAPQLEPMDFHAVVEALVEGRWLLVDATRLAPRRGMIRIATGRDAADTAFVTNTLADVVLRRMRVEATSSESLGEDPGELIELG